MSNFEDLSVSDTSSYTDYETNPHLAQIRDGRIQCLICDCTEIYYYFVAASMGFRLEMLLQLLSVL